MTRRSNAKTTTRPAARPQAAPQPMPAANIVTVPQKLLNERRNEDSHLINALVTAASNPATDVDKMERLWTMHKEAVAMRAEHEFAMAKNMLAINIPPIPKSSKIEFVDKNNKVRETPYSTRQDIEKVIGPLYLKAGFSTEYSCDYIDGKIMTVLIVRHNGGHKEVYKSPPMPLDTSGSKNNNQAAGSTSEYGKRYALIGAFNIIGADVDDDGNKGSGAGKGEDRFAAKVAEEAAGPIIDGKATTVKDPKAALEGYAGQLMVKLQKAETVERRGEILMANMKLVNELEEAGLKDIVVELRALAEGVSNG